MEGLRLGPLEVGHRQEVSGGRVSELKCVTQRTKVADGQIMSFLVLFGFVLFFVFFKKKLIQKKHKMRRLQGHKQEIASSCASCERRWPVMSTLCSEEPVILRNVEVQTGKRWTSLLSMPKGPVVIL